MNNKELLEKQILKLQEMNVDIDGWKYATVILLERIFGEYYSGIKSIQSIKHIVTNLGEFGSKNNYRQCQEQGKAILEACITELEEFGTPNKKDSNNKGMEITLIQNQTLNISIVISVLKENLEPAQIDEIRTIVQADEPRPNKIKRIVDKIESFGSNVASNVLASILSNPSIWS